MNKLTFIAEIGVNHGGDFDKAQRMCRAAHKAGATYIKGQFYNPYQVLGRSHPDLNYALQCQFTRQQHELLAEYCTNLGTPYFVSVFNVGDIGWADRFCPVHKVASRMNLNQEFIAKIEQTKKPVFMSIQPEMGIRIPERFKLMWCLREYPSTKEQVLDYPYTRKLGLSSHCPDASATLEAIKRGALVIENHVCESRAEPGCDISSSLTLEEYAELIKDATPMPEVLTSQRKD